MPRSRFGDSDEWGAEREGNPVLRHILQRSWLLIVPLVALAWFNAREVAPLAKKLSEQVDVAKQDAEKRRAATLTDARRVGIQISLLRALSDTLEVRFAKYDGLIDSVYALRAADLDEVRALEAQMDSLRRIYADASGKSTELSALLPPMQARIDSLKSLIASRDEEVRRLEIARRADLELTERVLNPNAYRKNKALWEGPGHFPNRDTLPKR